MKQKPSYRPLKKLLLLFTFFPTLTTLAQDEHHKEVVAAIQWELPVNECKKPRLIAQSSNVVDGEGAREITDVDSYTIGRYKRKEKRWQKCVDKYKKGLMKDFEQLKDSASHGLTQTQADQILAKMALIQQVYMSPDGIPNKGDSKEVAN